MTRGVKRDPLSAFARGLLREWRRLGLAAGAGERVVVAASGGADSTALLLALDELIGAGRLGCALTVAHLDHGLRGEAGRGDARFVAETSARLGHGFELGDSDVSARARETGDNLEQAARRARYEFLGRAARGCGARVVVSAHTVDDQAETLLLALVRGSGARGLGGMSPARALDAVDPPVLLARPLLAWARRADTEGYCRARGVEWRADAMNDDERFARVRARRKLLPLLETFNPRAARALARTAELLREDSAALDAEAARLLAEATDEAADRDTRPPDESALLSDGGARVSDERASPAGGLARPLRTGPLSAAQAALRRRALRLWLAEGRGDLRRLASAHVAGVERLLGGERGGRVAELPGGARVERRGRWLFFRPAGGGGAGGPGGRGPGGPGARGKTDKPKTGGS